MLNLAVFASGGGSNFGAVLDAIDRGAIDAEVKVLVASKPEIYAIERAKARNIPVFVSRKSDYETPDARFAEIDKVLARYGADFIALLGALMILPASFVKKYERRIVNIHPSLIPKHCGHGYYGLKVHKAVLDAGDRVSGATVHYVDEGTDTGEIILRREVPVLPGDTPEALAARVLETEHKIIVEALSRVSKERKKGEWNMKRRALISVSDKTGVVEFARALEELGFEVVSTGGTLKTLVDAGVNAINVSAITGFQECLDGRVKTLHPVVHAGILAMRGNPEHMAQLQKLGIDTIDVVAVNLYPFKATIMKPGVELQEAIENIDIGGPTMLRAAAKNYQDVYVVSDPADYDAVIEKLKSGDSSLDFKFRLMYKVFQHTGIYDTLIANYLQEKLGIEFPDFVSFAYEKQQDLRYGENPHQSAAFYRDCLPYPGSLTAAKQRNGKELSYNNINDTNGALDLLREFQDRPTVVAVKHANPCGVGSADTVAEAYRKAYACDPVSIFGGIVAANREIDAETAEELRKTFLEIVVAPSYTAEALEILRKKPNLRVLELRSINTPLKSNSCDMKKVVGGILVQDHDRKLYDEADYRVVTKRAPTAEELEQLVFAYKVVKHTKSNAIALAKDFESIGIGAGQTNRIWAAEQAIEHANGAELDGKPLGDRARGAVLASDAFFPFGDCVEAAAKAGITAIIQPGGSKRDQESIDACDKYGIAMVFVGARHFKH